MIKALGLFLLLTVIISFHGQAIGADLWVEIQDAQVGQAPDPATNMDSWVKPANFRLYRLDIATLKGILASAPLERLDLPFAQRPVPAALVLPDPDGKLRRFSFVETPVMDERLSQTFPEIKTYLGRLDNDPSVSVRFDITPAGFHAQVLDKNGTWYIDPYEKGISYASYYRRDLSAADRRFECLVESNPGITRQLTTYSARSGDQLRTYRLAVACTGEYAQFHGGTKAAAQAAIVTTINRVTGIYELELGIRLTLIYNLDILYTNSATDPFDNNNAFALINQSQTVIDNAIGNANYDIGHTVSTGGGGLAGLGVVCSSGGKARGITGSSYPTGDAFDVDYVAHEIGHQFGANHTFNGTTGSCSGGNRNASTAYEPGSGSTIMAYAGICGTDDLQNNTDPVFHSESHREIITYVTSAAVAACPQITATGNSIPTANAGADYTIPVNTPFRLTGSGSDGDSTDILTYFWEERDLGPQAALSAPDDGSIPLFRVFTPTSSTARYFPKLSTLVTNTQDNSEKLPQLGRTMTFRFTVRDQKGGVDSDDISVTVDGNSGPFRVTYPDQYAALSGTITVTWDVAGTSSSPVSCSTVNIYLSLDGGQTFDFANPLAALTPNDGSEPVDLGNTSSSQARIMVMGADSIFFDISNADFTIGPGGGGSSPTLQYTWTMDTDPGWSTQGLWAWGTPTGGGGDHGNTDPTAGHTGTRVYGYNLSGDYENNLPERHLTTAVINCAGLQDVTLKFWRWLGVERSEFDHAYVRVSTNGTAWTTVWENSSANETEDPSWNQQIIDISNIADNQSTVYLRWTMGTTDESWRFCGWNIDDVEIWAVDTSSSGCPDCSTSDVILRDITLGNGSDCDCTAASSITLGPNVLIENGARLNLNAPLITITPGVIVESGAVLNTNP